MNNATDFKPMTKQQAFKYVRFALQNTEAEKRKEVMSHYRNNYSEKHCLFPTLQEYVLSMTIGRQNGA